MRKRDPFITFRFLRSTQLIGRPSFCYHHSPQRRFSSSAIPKSSIPNFAFAFDIDGVLLRSSKAIPGASKALSHLQRHRIPFILLTNGGGKDEEERVKELSERLGVPLDVSMFVQSHTPFAELVNGVDGGGGMRDKCVLVVGGEGGKCRAVAEKYGFRNVVTPGDIYTQHPSIWPFGSVFKDYYESFARPLSKPILEGDPAGSLKIDAIFVYHDPRDWALDTQIILDVLLSSKGIMGTLSPKNNDQSLPNRGFLQDGQPSLYFSNADLWWAAEYPLNRLGQGGFREALEGVWAAVTGGPREDVHLKKVVIGKPFRETYEFAEKKLVQHRNHLFHGSVPGGLKKVFMVGDNPESDIRGANTFQSPAGANWSSILVRSGVYSGGEPAWKPNVVVDDVWQAVQWALEQSKWTPIPDK